MSIDIHSHILPGLDDGSDDWEQSLRMASIAAEDGISKIVCTPHWSPVFPDNGRNRILAAVEEFRIRITDEAIPIEVYPGCELVVDFDLPQKIGSGEVLSINDERRFALVEMPHEILPPKLERFFWRLQVEGITPILGHPERNRQILNNHSMLPGWIEAGALIQITAGSLAGYFGKQVRKLCTEMLRHRFVHFVATDAHSDTGKRNPALSEAREIVADIIGSEAAEKIFLENPSCILRGELPEVDEPISPPAGKQSLISRLFPFW